MEIDHDYFFYDFFSQTDRNNFLYFFNFFFLLT